MARRKRTVGTVIGSGLLRNPVTGKAVPKPKAPDLTRPPTGTYDPALDAQEQAAGRGLEDLRHDIERDRTYAQDDYLRNRSETSFDYNQNLAGLMRRYNDLGVTQSERAGAAGVATPQTLAAQMRIRAQNMALDRAPMDVGYQRRQGGLVLGQQRRLDQWTTQLGRAGRENQFFGTDTAAQRFFQARQSGWVPPEEPPKRKRKARTVGRVTGGGVVRSTAAGMVVPHGFWPVRG